MTNQTTNGQKPSASQLLDNLNSRLDSFETSIGLPVHRKDSEVDRFMGISPAELRTMTPEDVGEGAFILRRYALYLQRLYNREVATVNRVDAAIRKVITNEVGQHRAASAEERRDLAVAGNEHASKLRDLRHYHQACLDQLNYQSKLVGDMAHSLEELQRSKMRKN